MDNYPVESYPGDIVVEALPTSAASGDFEDGSVADITIPTSPSGDHAGSGGADDGETHADSFTGTGKARLASAEMMRAVHAIDDESQISSDTSLPNSSSSDPAVFSVDDSASETLQSIKSNWRLTVKENSFHEGEVAQLESDSEISSAEAALIDCATTSDDAIHRRDCETSDTASGKPRDEDTYETGRAPKCDDDDAIGECTDGSRLDAETEPAGMADETANSGSEFTDTINLSGEDADAELDAPIGVEQLSTIREVSYSSLDASKESEPAKDDDDGDKERLDDILGSGQIMRTILRKSDGRKPLTGNCCVISYQAYKFEGTEAFHLPVDGAPSGGIPVLRADDIQLIVGDADEIGGLEVVLLLMNIGEKSRVILHPRFAYGEFGDPTRGIPQNATLVYDVELKEASEIDQESLGAGGVFRLAEDKKLHGNGWVALKNYHQAVKGYARGLAYLESEVTKSDKELSERVNRLSLLLYSNLSLCQLKLQAFDACLRSIDSALQIEPDHVKSLLRRANVLSLTSHYDDAQRAVERAREVVAKQGSAEQWSKLIVQEESSIRNLKRKAEDKEREIYRRMFKPMALDPNQKRSGKKGKFLSGRNKWLWLGALASVAVGMAIGAFYLRRH